MNDILTTIFKNTYSLNQLKHRVSVLKQHLLHKFFGGEVKTLSENDAAWLKSVSEEFMKQLNKDNVYQIFEYLEKQIVSIKPLIIYLTFEPDDQSLAEIGEMVRKTFNNQALVLDIKYDPRLIAGAALSWNGLYRDYSLKARIEERKMVILESFKKYLRQ